MRWLYLIVTAFVLVLISSCFDSPVETVAPTVERPASFYEALKEKDKNRDDVLEKSKETYKDSKNCEDDDDCEDICSDIYIRRSDKSDCKELSVAQVRRMEKVHDILDDKKTNQLDDINLDDLEVIINISLEPIEKIFKTYGSTKARDVLNWIADDEDAARLFESEDADFVLLDTLLKEINSNPSAALSRNLKGGDRYHEIALTKDNEHALDWVHLYFEDKLCESQSTNKSEDACVLSQYCLISHSAGTDFSEVILDYSRVESFLKRMLDEPPKKGLWLFKKPDEVDTLKDVCRPFCQARPQINGESC